MHNVSEKDWKLLKERLAIWQERYIKSLNEKYIKILSGDGSEAEKFWALEKRINEDKYSSGVVTEMRRSNFYDIIGELIANEIITESELEGFSQEVIDSAKRAQKLGE